MRQRGDRPPQNELRGPPKNELRRLALRQLALLWLPLSRRELGAALFAEASAVPPGRQRLGWLAGGAWFVVKEGVMRRFGYGLGLLAAAAALVVVDRIGSSDDAGQVSMLVLLAAAGVLGFAEPRRAWLPALVLGSSLAIAGMIYAATDLEAGHTNPPGVSGAATLLVLVIPAALAAGAGAAIRKVAKRPH